MSKTTTKPNNTRARIDAIYDGLYAAGMKPEEIVKETFGEETELPFHEYFVRLVCLAIRKGVNV